MIRGGFWHFRRRNHASGAAAASAAKRILAFDMTATTSTTLALFAVAILVSLCCTTTDANDKVNFREKEKQVLDQILGPGRYDARIRPSGVNGTGIQRAADFPRAVDRRTTQIQRFWRISLTLSCPMNLKLYPLDRQVCSLKMASYGWTTDDLVFLWKDGDPVQVVKNLHLPRFTLEKFLTDYCNSKTNTGEYSCLKVDLMFKREFSYYLIQIYIPCCMLVIVSWVSFWLDQGAVPARVSLGVTTLLTMATQTSGINASLPPVSYTKAIDVWTGVCLTFVFGALLEFALVNYASRSDMHRENMKKQRRQQYESEHALEFEFQPLVRHPGDPMAIEKLRPCEIHVPPQRDNCCRSWLSKFPTRSKRIDVISRITFPLVFAMFNLVYWSTYLFRDEGEET
ncbi:glutamate-gated chloride channel isoform X8 [Cloeon dipterum]|uniref:glutamate-gated chloride channel isoform X8 n=1 Tax=Cloeon dipterum TaxID=197152 RepID=UPI00321FC0D9